MIIITLKIDPFITSQSITRKIYLFLKHLQKLVKQMKPPNVFAKIELKCRNQIAGSI